MRDIDIVVTDGSYYEEKYKLVLPDQPLTFKELEKLTDFGMWILAETNEARLEFEGKHREGYCHEME